MEEFLGNPSWLRLVLDVLTMLITVVLWIIVSLLRKISKANDEIMQVKEDLIAIKAATEAVGGLAGLVGKITAHIASAPDKQDIAKLHQRDDEILASTKEMKGELRGIKNMVDILNKVHIKS